jgi:hypothetical protein
MFAGGMAVPPLFGLSISGSGGFGISYTVGAIATLVSGLMLALPQRR